MLETQFPLRHLSGMTNLLAAYKYGRYGDIRKAIIDLPKETQTKVKKVIPPRFLEIFQNEWGVLK
jgi:hypothetical protein